jgi:5-formyltetrahydrofolate cyclo-ligase
MNIDETKKLARAEAAAIRKQASADNPDAGEKLRDQIVEHAIQLGLSLPYHVSAFLPIGSEIDTLPTMRSLADLGHITALPVVIGKDQPLIFRKWFVGEKLVPGAFGTSEPLASEPEIIPEILLVPMLAFDAQGYRLGYGGGYYDRTIEKFEKLGPITTVGIAFSAQHVDTVPRGPHDRSLQWVATERDLIRVK